MRLLLATTFLAAMTVAPAHAGEIILVDPLSGTTRTVTGSTVLAPGDTQTDVERARERVRSSSSSKRDHHETYGGHEQPHEDNPEKHMDADGSSTIVILPHVEDPLSRTLDGRKATTGEAARRATDRAGSYVLEEGEVQTGVDRKSIVIIDDGKVTVVKEGERVDNKTRLKVNLMKARAYRQKDKPCGGSVIVGGVGESGTPTSSGVSYSKDVSVLSNCR